MTIKSFIVTRILPLAFIIFFIHASVLPIHLYANDIAIARHVNITMGGSMVLAIDIAYNDFNEHLRHLANSGSSLASYLSNIVNYEMTIEQDNTDFYVIRFFPKIDIGKGIIIHGGGGEYIIGAKDHKLRAKEFYK